MKTVQLSSTHLKISGENIKLKEGSRFSVTPDFFNLILKDYKTDIDLYFKDNIKPSEDIDMKVRANTMNDNAMITASSKSGRIIWISEPIHDTQMSKIRWQCFFMVSILSAVMSAVGWYLGGS